MSVSFIPICLSATGKARKRGNKHMPHRKSDDNSCGTGNIRHGSSVFGAVPCLARVSVRWEFSRNPMIGFHVEKRAHFAEEV